METYMPKANEIHRNWYIVDASGKTLGRLSSEIARVLAGKHKVDFAPHLDNGDHVVVINADKIKLTGDKLQQKYYYRHSGYPGGIKSVSCGELMSTRPERVVLFAVRGMLPKNKLGRRMLKRLRVYKGEEHPHYAQKPEVWKVEA